MKAKFPHHSQNLSFLCSKNYYVTFQFCSHPQFFESILSIRKMWVYLMDRHFGTFEWLRTHNLGHVQVCSISNLLWSLSVEHRSIQHLDSIRVSLRFEFKVGYNFCSIAIVISVRSWNFKDGGSLKASFLAKNQHATKEKSLKKSYE